MSIVNSIEDAGTWRKKLEIEIPADEISSEAAKVVNEFRRQIDLPGFRKGKVPASLIEKRFRSEIDQEVVERLVPRFWRKAEEESDLEALLPPSIGEVDVQVGEPLVFEATVDVRPDVELQSLEDFELPEIEREPSEEEIDRAIEQQRERAADWVDVEREAAAGDLVTMESVELDEDGEPKGDPREDLVEVGHEQVWEELSLALTGLTVGQETDFRRQEDRGDDSRVGHFHVKVLAVQERDLPPVDDTLAAKSGHASLDELRWEIIDRLGQNMERESRRQREQALLDQLRERHPMELPQGVVDDEVRRMQRRQGADLARQGIDLERVQIDWEAMSSDVRPQAEKSVHARLLLDAIANEQNIITDESELEEKVAIIANYQRQPVGALREDMERDGQLDALAEQIRREKALNRLLGEDYENAKPGSGNDATVGDETPQDDEQEGED